MRARLLASALILAICGSSCVTMRSYSDLVYPDVKNPDHTRCEVRLYGRGGGELVLRGRMRGTENVILTTHLSLKLFDPAERLVFEQSDRPQLDVAPQSCAVLMPGQKWSGPYSIRTEPDFDQRYRYRLFATGPGGAVSPGAAVQLPLEIRSRRGLVAFVFLAPLLAIVDLTPIGWLTGLHWYRNADCH